MTCILHLLAETKPDKGTMWNKTCWSFLFVCFCFFASIGWNKQNQINRSTQQQDLLKVFGPSELWTQQTFLDHIVDNEGTLVDQCCLSCLPLIIVNSNGLLLIIVTNSDALISATFLSYSIGYSHDVESDMWRNEFCLTLTWPLWWSENETLIIIPSLATISVHCF